MEEVEAVFGEGFKEAWEVAIKLANEDTVAAAILVLANQSREVAFQLLQLNRTLDEKLQ